MKRMIGPKVWALLGVLAVVLTLAACEEAGLTGDGTDLPGDDVPGDELPAPVPTELLVIEGTVSAIVDPVEMTYGELPVGYMDTRRVRMLDAQEEPRLLGTIGSASFSFEIGTPPPAGQVAIGEFLSGIGFTIDSVQVSDPEARVQLARLDVRAQNGELQDLILVDPDVEVQQATTWAWYFWADRPVTISSSTIASEEFDQITFDDLSLGAGWNVIGASYLSTDNAITFSTVSPPEEGLVWTVVEVSEEVIVDGGGQDGGDSPALPGEEFELAFNSPTVPLFSASGELVEMEGGGLALNSFGVSIVVASEGEAAEPPVLSEVVKPSGEFSLTVPVPDATLLTSAVDYLGEGEYDITPSTVQFVEVQVAVSDSSGDCLGSPRLRNSVNGEYGSYHRYMYATEEVTITGQTDRGTFGNGETGLTLSPGWNAIITTPGEGLDPMGTLMSDIGPIEAAGWIAIQLLQEPQGQ
jgi:hypothetical protein